MSKPIEVRIERSEIDDWGSSVTAGHVAVQRLQKAGAPVEGPIGLTRVTRGRLVIEEDDFGDLIYRWEP